MEFGEQDETYPMSISVIVCIVLLKALIHTMYTLQQALILVYIFRSIRVYLLHTYGQLQGAHSNYVSAAITYCTYDVLRIILFCDDTRVINRPILGRSGGGGGGRGGWDEKDCSRYVSDLPLVAVLVFLCNKSCIYHTYIYIYIYI